MVAPRVEVDNNEDAKTIQLHPSGFLNFTVEITKTLRFIHIVIIHQMEADATRN
jgi:hypothetical protein